MTEKRTDSSPTSYPCYPKQIPDTCMESESYQLRFAQSTKELTSIQQLRYQVFKDALPADQQTDMDSYDPVCHHLLVEHRPSGKIVGTYRMQCNDMAKRNLGFYSIQEYCIDQLPESVLENAIEIGRVCTHEAHRNILVLQLLWRGLAAYMQWNKKRYLFGCSSLFSQDPAEGNAVLTLIRKKGGVHPSIWVDVQAKYQCESDALCENTQLKIPKLLRTYIMFGSKVCSPPALDRDFKSIDFLTLFDLRDLSEHAYQKFFLS